MEKAGPLAGREGEVPGIGVLGVADGGTTGQVGDLNAVLTCTAVAALTEAGGDVGYLNAVLTSAAVTTLPEHKVVHDRSSIDSSRSWRKSMV